jgi:hypothetical protein
MLLALLLIACHPSPVDTADSEVSSLCTWYADADADGYGVDEQPGPCDTRPEGTASLGGDCDDGDWTVNPGAVEDCDGVDDDCDGGVDEGLLVTVWVDADGDGYGDDERPLDVCELEEGQSQEGADCDDADASTFPGAEELCDGVDNDCDGVADSGEIGSSLICAAVSCRALLDLDPELEDGLYPIASLDQAYELLCDMGTDGGGWTLGFLKNSVDYDTYATFGAGNVDADELVVHPSLASGSADAYGGWIDLNELPYDELVLAAYHQGVESYRSNPIAKSELRIEFGQDGYYLYGGASGYVWCGGAHAYTDNGIGQVNQPDGAYQDCRGHGSLGSGWDFSTSTAANQGLTMCGVDAGSNWMYAQYGATMVTYTAAGAAYAIWVR